MSSETLIGSESASYEFRCPVPFFWFAPFWALAGPFLKFEENGLIELFLFSAKLALKGEILPVFGVFYTGLAVDCRFLFRIMGFYAVFGVSSEAFGGSFLFLEAWIPSS